MSFFCHASCYEVLSNASRMSNIELRISNEQNQCVCMCPLLVLDVVVHLDVVVLIVVIDDVN